MTEYYFLSIWISLQVWVDMKYFENKSVKIFFWKNRDSCALVTDLQRVSQYTRLNRVVMYKSLTIVPLFP